MQLLKYLGLAWRLHSGPLVHLTDGAPRGRAGPASAGRLLGGRGGVGRDPGPCSGLLLLWACPRRKGTDSSIWNQQDGTFQRDAQLSVCTLEPRGPDTCGGGSGWRGRGATGCLVQSRTGLLPVPGPLGQVFLPQLADRWVVSLGLQLG